MKHHKYKARPYAPGDLKLMNLLDDEREVIEANEEFFEALADKNKTRKTCISVCYKGAILFLVGYYEVEPGVAQVFVIPDRRITEHPLAFVRAVKHWRQWLEKREWCRRIQTSSLPTKLIDHWMRKIGFVCEAKLVSYTESGQDYNLWSREKRNGVWGRQEASSGV